MGTASRFGVRAGSWVQPRSGRAVDSTWKPFMRQKRRHTCTVSFVEVPLGPLRAGGAPESTKQPRYPGTAGRDAVCVAPSDVPGPRAAPAPRPAGPLTVARGDVAVAPVDALLRLRHVAPRLHVAVRVPAGGEGVQVLLPKIPPPAPPRPRVPQPHSRAILRADGRGQILGFQLRTVPLLCSLPLPPGPRPLAGLSTPLSSRSGEPQGPRPP